MRRLGVTPSGNKDDDQDTGQTITSEELYSFEEYHGAWLDTYAPFEGMPPNRVAMTL